MPVEDVDSLYLYGEVDLNTKLLNFLSQKKIPLHVFNYSASTAGSYYPREYLHSGYLLVHQVGHYADADQAPGAGPRTRARAPPTRCCRNVAYYSAARAAPATTASRRARSAPKTPPSQRRPHRRRRRSRRGRRSPADALPMPVEAAPDDEADPLDAPRRLGRSAPTRSTSCAPPSAACPT